MPVITKIEAQKNKKAFNIFLDGKFAFSLNPVVLLLSHLRKNQVLTDGQIIDLTFSSDCQRYYDLAVNFISFRPRSEKEVVNYLKRKLDKEKFFSLSASIVDKLKKNKFINDEYFADWFIDQRVTFKHKGKIAIKSELALKGIDPRIIEEKLAQIDDSGQLAQALALAEKRRERFGRLPWPGVKLKLVRFLSGKGYGWEIIKGALEELRKKG